MKQALSQRASVTQQEVLATLSSPASASPPPRCQHIPPHWRNALIQPQVPLAAWRALPPQGPGLALTFNCSCGSWHPLNKWLLFGIHWESQWQDHLQELEQDCGSQSPTGMAISFRVQRSCLHLPWVPLQVNSVGPLNSRGRFHCQRLKSELTYCKHSKWPAGVRHVGTPRSWRKLPHSQSSCWESRG